MIRWSNPAWAFAAAVCVVATPAVAQPGPVFVVRHAERAPEPKSDPAISTEGQARAEQLRHVLATADIRTIITNHYRRTQDTAAPTALHAGVTPTVIPIRRGEVSAHVAEVVAEVRKAKGAVLVVGHSNTVAAIVAGLSTSTPVELCETSFANLFVVAQPGTPAPAIQLKYGKPDVPPHPGCQ